MEGVEGRAQLPRYLRVPAYQRAIRVSWPVAACAHQNVSALYSQNWFVNRANSPAARTWAQFGLARVPLVGPLLRAWSVAKIARTLAMLLRAGVLVAEALGICQGVVAFAPLEGVIQDVCVGVTRGEPFSRSHRRHPRDAPALLVAMVAVGEEIRNLTEMLERVATLFEREVDEALALLTASLEPLLIIGLSLVVGTVAYAWIMPMVALVGAIG